MTWIRNAGRLHGQATIPALISADRQVESTQDDDFDSQEAMIWRCACELKSERCKKHERATKSTIPRHGNGPTSERDIQLAARSNSELPRSSIGGIS